LAPVNDHPHVIRQSIRPMLCPESIIIIVQEWPCWLAPTLALKLPLQAAFFPKEFQAIFNAHTYAPLTNFAAMWTVLPECNPYMVLASGSNKYLSFVLPKL